MHIYNLTLLGTEHCHLCDQAHEIVHLTLISNVEYKNKFNFYKIDILQEPILYASHALKIPVLQLTVQKNTQELCWPFTQENIQEFLTRYTKSGQ